MGQRIRSGWRQALSRILARWLPQQPAQQQDAPLWSSSFFVCGGPVQTVQDRAHDIIVTVALPGIEPTEVTMALEDNRLLIQGKSAAPADDQVPAYTERGIRTLIRSALLPCEVDLDRASMRRQHGLWQITLPKRKAA